jgi:glycosyltransferase involved in cell wall biosynthesis
LTNVRRLRSSDSQFDGILNKRTASLDSNPMNVLFVHNNFPAQFQHVARALARESNVRVAAIGSSTSCPVGGVKLVRYKLTDVDVSATHPFARRFDVECRRAEQVLYALTSFAATKFVPDVIVAHCGWGETLKNASSLLALSECDSGVAPTSWQRSTFPELLQQKIIVQHEGVDVDVARPSPDAGFRLRSGRLLRSTDEVVTFAARNLEPVRGYHIFMRALPKIMAERPGAEIIIVGGHGTSYGARPKHGESWKSIFLKEISAKVDMERIHFTDHLPYRDYLSVLQVSSAHVYFTYPFVLSWSLLEAMSVGCFVVGSDTPPVREVINNNQNGVLVPFFDVEGLADSVIRALSDRERCRRIRMAARQTVLDRFDLHRVCLPKIMAFLRGMVASPSKDG